MAQAVAGFLACLSRSRSRSRSLCLSPSVCVLCVICKTDVSHMSRYAICGHMSLLTSNSGTRATALPLCLSPSLYCCLAVILSYSLKIAAIVCHLILCHLKFIHNICMAKCNGRSVAASYVNRRIL